jgi:hypothetical protein
VFLDAALAAGIAQLGLAAFYPISAVAPAEEGLVAFAHAIVPLIEGGIREAFAAWASSI